MDYTNTNWHDNQQKAESFISDMNSHSKKDKTEKFKEIDEEFKASHKVKNEMVKNYNSTLMGVYHDKEKKDHSAKELV